MPAVSPRVRRSRQLLFEALYNIAGTHVPVRRLRRAWLRAAGADVAPGADVFLGTTVLGATSVVIGPRAQIGFRCVIDGRGGIEIGPDAVVASDSQILTADHDIRSPDFEARYAPVRLEHHTWIGTGAMVLKGVTVGHGGVVAARALATRDVEPMTVVAGIPAVPISTRPGPLEYRIGRSPRLY